MPFKLGELKDKSIAIASRLDSNKAINLTRDLIKFLMEDKKIKVNPEARIANLVNLPMLGMPLYEMTRDKIAAILCIGGDGTVLRVAQNLPLKNPPAILGINVGAVGFLAEFDMPAVENFPQLLSTNFYFEKCMRLSCFLEDQGYLPPAMNEVLIITSRPSKALSVVISVDGQVFSSGYVDGIIASTSTGSTAYSLSAGGTIMVPEMEAIQIVPVCPFARTGIKPLIIKPNSRIEIELMRPKLNAIISIDGQREYTINPTNKIKIKRSPHNITFLRSKNLKQSFFSRLNRKLLPGASFPVPKRDGVEE
ncbi:MAG: NAD(+)/NADH kinase [Candidatus Hodarchaeota archaeon]